MSRHRRRRRGEKALLLVVGCRWIRCRERGRGRAQQAGWMRIRARQGGCLSIGEGQCGGVE